MNDIKDNALIRVCILPIYKFGIVLLAWVTRFRYFFSAKISITARVLGWRSVRIGHGAVICGGTWINVNKPSFKHIQVLISDKVFIGRNNFVSTGDGVVFREMVLTGEGCSFIGATHTSNPARPYVASGVDSLGAIYIGVNVFLGYGASVVGDVRIGHGSIVGAHTVVLSSVPPFSIVVGNPARVIKRYSFMRQEWVGVADFDSSLEDYPSEEVYLEQLSSTRCIHLPKILANEIFKSTL